MPNDLFKDDTDVNQLKSEFIQFLNLTKEEKNRQLTRNVQTPFEWFAFNFPKYGNNIKNLSNNASQQCQWRTFVFCSEKNKQLFEEYIISK
jgi:hypothetical protein